MLSRRRERKGVSSPQALRKLSNPECEGVWLRVDRRQRDPRVRLPAPGAVSVSKGRAGKHSACPPRFRHQPDFMMLRAGITRSVLSSTVITSSHRLLPRHPSGAALNASFNNGPWCVDWSIPNAAKCGEPVKNLLN